jgi:hypothetical protein
MQSVRDTSYEIKTAAALADSLYGIVVFLKDSIQLADNIFSSQETDLGHTCIDLIIHYFRIASSPKVTRRKLVAAEMSIITLNEPFYSGIFANCLRKLTKSI